MNITQLIWTCPKCGADLSPAGNAFRCPAGHSYDRAKEGYVNLLLSQTGGTHGDNREMIAARRAFLDLGYYDPLADALIRRVSADLPQGGVVLDGGAGEGFYTDRLTRALQAAGKDPAVFAFDISKEAVRFFSKRNRDVSLAVAGVYQMPVRTGSVDAALNFFAPLAAGEIWRVLKPHGRFYMAIPEREHLFGLKAAIYDTPYKNTVADPALPGFALVGNDEIRYAVTLRTAEEIRALFAMTPYAYRTGEEGRARLEALQTLTTELHFRLFTYEKLI